MSWERKKDKNPYHHGSWINTQKGLLVTIISDMGFGKQRNVVVENYRHQLLTGFETIKVGYLRSQKEALKWAQNYMRNNK